jgi:hypothetical protein
MYMNIFYLDDIFLSNFSKNEKFRIFMDIFYDD